MTYTPLTNDEVPGKFVFRVDLSNKSPLTLDHNETTRWEIHFTHVYGIEDFVAALNGIELFDHYTQEPVGLELFRFGGFYWKFMTNNKWKKLGAGESLSFTLLGNNWMSSSSDIFNNWVLSCLEPDFEPKFATIISTKMEGNIMPSKMAVVDDDLFKRNKLDIMESWDKNGGLERYKRYEGFQIQHTEEPEDKPPRFDYRGLMIDFGRNFFKSIGDQPFERLIVEILSKLKLNKLHMHLSESQGWRLEIPGLESLTEFGAARCYGNFNWEDGSFPCLWPEPQDTVEDTKVPKQYFSRDEFIQLLTYAKSMDVDIVVEFDFPAHSRAAIQSMEYEAYRYGNTEYRLADPDETFNATGWARYYDDNINVCQESTYKFIEKVVTEVKLMYVEAGFDFDVNRPIMHIGGDETPQFAWELSPKCDKFKAENGLETTNDLFTHHIKRHAKIVDDAGFQVAAWEEAFVLNHKNVLPLDELGLSKPPIGLARLTF